MATKVLRLLRGEQNTLDINSGWTVQYVYFVAGSAITASTARSAVDDTTGLSVPRIGDAHPENADLVVRSVDLGEMTPCEHGSSYEVTVKYFTPTVEGELLPGQGVQYRWSQMLYTEQVDADIDGNPFINAVGDPLMNTYTDTLNALMLEVQRDEPVYNPTTGYLRSNAVNRQAMTLFGTWSIEAEQMYCESVTPMGWNKVGGSPRQKIQYRFLIKPGYLPWQPHARNIGFNGWFDNGGVKTKGEIRLKNSPNEQVSTPVNLSNTGLPMNESFYGIGGELKTPVENLLFTGSIVSNNSQSVPRCRFYQPAGGQFWEVIFTRKRLYDFRGILPGIM